MNRRVLCFNGNVDGPCPESKHWDAKQVSPLPFVGQRDECLHTHCRVMLVSAKSPAGGAGLLRMVGDEAVGRAVRLGGMPCRHPVLAALRALAQAWSHSF